MISRVQDLLTNPENLHSPRWSLEFFPPKDAIGEERLRRTLKRFKETCDPLFYSVTWGAGGSTLRGSLDVVEFIQKELGITALAHLTGLGMTPSSTQSILNSLDERGIQSILALRGDRSFDGGEGSREEVPFRFAADLIRFIRQQETKSKASRRSIVAAACPEGHPDTPDLDRYIDHLVQKINEGVDALITQFFFDNDRFYSFRDKLSRRLGVNCTPPLIPGIMIITKASAIHRMIELSHCSVPPEVQEGLNRFQNDDSAMTRWGIHFAVQQVLELRRHGINYFHFYTLNRFDPTYEVIQTLNPIVNSTARSTIESGGSGTVIIPFRSFYATPDEREMSALLKAAGIDTQKPHDIVFNQTLKRFEITQRLCDRLHY